MEFHAGYAKMFCSSTSASYKYQATLPIDSPAVGAEAVTGADIVKDLHVHTVVPVTSLIRGVLHSVVTCYTNSASWQP